MTQQEFARMTAVIDVLLEEAEARRYLAGFASSQTGGCLLLRAKDLEDAAADILAALPVPEDE